MTASTTTFITRSCLPLAALAASLGCDSQVDPDYEGEAIAEIRGSVNVGDTEPPADSNVAILWLTASEGDECSGAAAGCSYGVGGSGEADGECISACGEPSECNPEVFAAFESCIEACGAESFGLEVSFEPCASGATGAQVPITGEFPASFKLELFDAPPENALLADDGGVRIAYGLVFAVENGAPLDFDFEQEEDFSQLLGVAPKHAIVYVEDEVPAGSTWSEYLGGTLSAGFHVIEAVGGDVDCDPGVPESEDTCAQDSVTLRPAPEDLDTNIGLEFGPLWKLGTPI